MKVNRNFEPLYCLDYEPTFEQLAPMLDHDRPVVFMDYKEDDYRVYVKLGGVAVVAYIGISKEIMDKRFPGGYPNYDVMNLGVDVHGGFTFDGEFENTKYDDTVDKYYYYGWDYGHWGDRMIKSLSGLTYGNSDADTAWTPAMVKKEAMAALQQLKKKLTYD